MTPFPLGLQIEETSQSVPDSVFLWDELKSALDVQQYRPVGGQGMVFKELTDGTGHHYILKNGETHSYVRLSPEEFWVWEKMDGEKTVQQLVLAYFMQYKAFAFAAIVSLVERLREANMLTDPPHHLYAETAKGIYEQSLSYKLTYFSRTIFTKEFVIKNLDRHMENIHRYGGWMLFTAPVQILFLLVTVIGLALFAILAQDPRYNLLGTQIFLRLGLLAYVPLLIHEFGHAITAKHVGCEVYKGGAMLYYGLPAAFIDTTDVWMFGKRARLMVTWAGPYTGYIIGGALSIIVYLSPNMPLETAVLFLQIALISIFTTSMNILPLLKLDGYYLLADSLEIPRLRERSLDFLAKDLRAKLSKREKWTREESIFLAFGILAFLSTIYFTWRGVAFWDRQATQSVSKLFNLNSDIGAMVFNIAIIFLAASSIIYSLIFIADGIKNIIAQLRSRGLLSTRWRAAVFIIIGALIFTYLPRAALPTLAVWFLLLSGVSAFVFSVWLAYSIFKDMRGSTHAWMWLTVMLGTFAGALSFIGEVNPHWLGSGYSFHEAGIILMLVSFVLAGRQLFGLHGSWRQTSLLLMALGVVAWVAALFAPIELHVLAGFLILGSLYHWQMRPAAQIKPNEQLFSTSTHGKMLLVFTEIKTTILSELESDFGKQTRAWVENGSYRPRKNSIGNAEILASMTDMTPNDYGSALALGLEELLSSVERAAGRKYAWRALAYGYDKLNWELQEVAEDHILKYVRHSMGLSNELAATRNDLSVLLHSVPLFINLTEDEISVLGKRFKSQHFERGDAVVRAGESGDSFYIIHSGRAEVLSAGGERLNTLRRGDYFGEASLLTNTKRNATIRALSALEVLVLSKYHFDRIIRTNVRFDEKARDEFHRLSVLRQIPIFENFEGLELKMLAKTLEKVDAAQGQVIFTQGERADCLYIIESGKIGVQIDGRERTALAVGEYFGEIALMMDVPRTATVTAIAPTVLLKLKADDFQELIQNTSGMQQALERASSRRVLTNERWLRESLLVSR